MMEVDAEDIMVTIGDVTVRMPVTPYESQKQIMEDVISGCQNSQHLLFESPGGSGKTLALLCSSLAWQRANAGQAVKIYYATRTHGQIQQVIDELKRTVYRDTNMAVLGSKKRTCIRDEEVNKDELCYNLRKRSENGCNYYPNKASINTYDLLSDKGINGAYDIEDLGELGTKHKACPYYAALDLAREADITFCPYDYILNPRIRESMGTDVRGKIVIFDEAHNIDGGSRKAGNVSVRVDQLMTAMDEYENVKPYCQRFIQFIVDIRTVTVTGQELVDKMLYFDILRDDAFDLPENPAPSYGTAMLEGTLKFARRMIREHGLEYGATVRSSDEGLLVLHLICLNAAVTFRPIAESARNVILGSGSVYSMEKLSRELDTTFPITRNVEWTEFERNDRVFIRTLDSTPSGRSLNAATWKILNDRSTQIDIGHILLDVCSIVPDGVLCFFPSYQVMNCLIDAWKRYGIDGPNEILWDEISSIKLPVIEQPDSNANDLMDTYREFILENSDTSSQEDSSSESEQRAVLLAVHRGKLSEGISFQDNLARAIVCVGLPLAELSSVKMKRQYNDRKPIEAGFPNGEEFYRIDAFNALNQSIGRCIRHRNDWGSIILLNQGMRGGDNLTDPGYQEFLPSWVRTETRNESNYEQLKLELAAFVNRHNGG